MGLGIQPDRVDPHAVLGRVALLLARDGRAGLPAALAVAVDTAGLRSAVLRQGDELLAAAGELVHAVPDVAPLRPPAGSVRLEVTGQAPAVLIVTGARPSALPLLRDLAVVLGAALAAVPARQHPALEHTPGSDPSFVPPPCVPVAVPAPTAAALLRDADQERSALADALHDGPVQDLLAARYAADAALRSPAPDLAAVRAAVQSAIVALRRTMRDLRPRGADGLGPALEVLSSRLVADAGTGLRLRVDPHADVLPAPAAALAYRLVQTVSPGSSPDTGIRVSLQPGRTPGTALLTVVGGAPLPDAPRWRRSVAALGGDLLVTAGRLHLSVPLDDVPGAPDPGDPRTPGDRLRLARPARTPRPETSSSTSKAVL